MRKMISSVFKRNFINILVLGTVLCVNATWSQCWVGLHTGAGFSISQSADGRLWSSGQNSSGCLGNPNHTSPFLYGIVNNDVDWQQISAGYNHILTIKTDGSLWGWGSNQLGQLGLGTNIGSSYIPVRIGNDYDWAFVCAGSNISMAIKTDGSLWGWGISYGNLIGTSTPWMDVQFPTRIGLANDWQRVFVSGGHVIAQKTNGSYWGWCRAESLGLGTQAVSTANSPVMLSMGSDWQKVSLGGAFTLLLKTDGTIWSTGNNMFGQLGDGTNVDKTDFVQIGNDNHWVDICAGSDFSVARKSNGTLWVWGNNGNSQLGLGSLVESQLSPVQLNNDTDWTQFSASEFRHVTALKTNGELWAWGSNSGEIGNGSFGISQYPEHISCSFLDVTTHENTLFSVFPNPAKTQLYLENVQQKAIDEISIIDMLGKELFRSALSAIPIDISRLPQGLYFIQIQSQGNTYTQKFIKE